MTRTVIPFPPPTVRCRLPRPARLSDFANGERGRVARISDSDPEMLRYFDSVGVSLDVEITVEERRDFAGNSVRSTRRQPPTPSTWEVQSLKQFGSSSRGSQSGSR